LQRRARWVLTLLRCIPQGAMPQTVLEHLDGSLQL
jgi:hypothetical protein